MNPYVVFVDHASPKANTTNIHKTTCGHYQKYLREGSEGTDWQEVPNIPSAITLARRLHKQYGTNGIPFMKCCMKEFASRNPVI